MAGPTDFQQNLNAGYDEAWHEIGATGQPAFQNGWVYAGAPYNTCAFRKDGFGFVHLKGVMKSGTIGSVAFTLPAGYRPAATVLSPTTTTQYVSVDSSGNVSGLFANTGTPIDGITFHAEQ